ncbi:heme peroxidase [Dichotomicrobium thermohalophilum]|uniref:Heme peroxidase n=1 Tax=Dichotomicrobium thermohalophilum TaxID=933063 RepID=A0A397QAQ6_9HYPH|nr:heme peroxidase [Dichotomicrobium thermohalophilum]
MGWVSRNALAFADGRRFVCLVGFVIAAGVMAGAATDVQAQMSTFADRFEHWHNARGADYRQERSHERYAPEPRNRSWREPREEEQAGRYHTVESGETLFRISKRYHVSVEALMRANGVSDPRELRVGQRLTIPEAGARTSSPVLQRDRAERPERRRYTEPRPSPDHESSRYGEPRRDYAPDTPEERPRARRQPQDRRAGSGRAALRRLAETMTEPAGRGQDSEIPAGYTFFAQLVGADLQVDQMLDGWRDGGGARRVSAELDLDIIYGDGPRANPERFYVPYIRTGPRLNRSGKRYALSRHMPPAGHIFVTQLQAALIELHNRAVDMLIERHLASEKSRFCESDDCSNVELARALPKSKQLLLFNDARETVIHYYHRVIVEDLVPRLIGDERTQDIVTNGRDLFFAAGFRDGEEIKQPFIPNEFALAAYQFTASQLRTSYKMREGERARRFDPRWLAANGGQHERLRSDDLADWRYFVDVLPQPPEGFNRARLIDPYLASVRRGWHENRRTRSTAEAILLAGARAGLRSGQAVAEKILPDLRKRGVLYLWEPRQEAGEADEPWRGYILPPDRPTRETISGETPLWYYVLQEADAMGAPTSIGPDTSAYAASPDGARYAAAGDSVSDGQPRMRGGHTLGPVGGTIVGEVLIGLAEHYAIKTGKGLGYRPPIGASAYGERDRFTLTRARGNSGELGERYLLRNLLIDAGVAVALR